MFNGHKLLDFTGLIRHFDIFNGFYTLQFIFGDFNVYFSSHKLFNLHDVTYNISAK